MIGSRSSVYSSVGLVSGWEVCIKKVPMRCSCCCPENRLRNQGTKEQTGRLLGGSGLGSTDPTDSKHRADGLGEIAALQDQKGPTVHIQGRPGKKRLAKHWSLSEQQTEAGI